MELSKIYHILGHNVSPKKYKKIEITTCKLSDHNTIKLELNNKRSRRKTSNNWKMNNTLLNDQWVTEGISSWNLVKVKT
jgi:hypothetical protein